METSSPFCQLPAAPQTEVREKPLTDSEKRKGRPGNNPVKV